MTLPEHAKTKPDLRVARIHVVRDDGWSTTYVLEDGHSVIVGSARHCGLQLASKALSGMHCVLRFMAGNVLLQDWCSSSGTYVDGRAISSEVAIHANSDVRLGEYHLRVVIEKGSAESLNGPAQDSTAAEAGRLACQIRHAAAPDDAPGPASAASGELSGSDRESLDRLTAQVNALEGELESERRASARLRDALEALTAQPSDLHRSSLDSCRDETQELLEAEVAALTSELAQRDAQLRELEALVSRPTESPHAESLQPDTAETARLIERLEAMLVELEQSDQRSATLQQLLRASEEANLAECNERQQMEAWLREIESRVAEREQEWHAEQQKLLERIDQLTCERDRAERLVAANDRQASSQILKTLRDENRQLREQLEQQQQNNSLLNQRLQVRERSAGGQHEDSALREERLKVAQERAEVSRLRAQLQAKLTELESGRREEPRKTAHQVDERFQAFRETIKQLHLEEQRERHGRGLADRLARLWRRLDGPTDRD